MGTAKQPTPVKLIVSMFTADPALFSVAQAKMCESFGPVDFVSEILPFAHTDYYTGEFGAPLWREFITFDRLVDPAQLVECKRLTNSIEQELAVGGKRRINLDPGYVSLSKLILATTKDHAHRIYLGQGIYGEVTLCYRDKKFTGWPWTYPDYGSPTYLQLFEGIRQRYAAQLRQKS
jgi:hypothetical protein